ncbi:mediator of RNA polymerase II transcription subunit 4 [Phymastichus coffea]|uniref:mediator of RNA polymerase II transcription subunit 4 n=1 Tax=Phymastichus coffea TaxID=108790 RepID=UPI00273BCB39|nr:mediator of RNA polymerase II transcription subunit 4 [Phymastichus coffea]
MSSSRSTCDVLLSIIDDIELISKELIENIIAQKHLKLSTTEHTQLIELLVSKNNELKAVLVKADEQAKINLKMESLKVEVDRQDQEIQNLQRQLKEAEQILATAIYQAKQKLKSIDRANKRPVHSEELIKFAHRISASNAICAPLTWQQGDQRRPYPTDIEMRRGFLGRMSDIPSNGQMIGPHMNLPGDFNRTGHTAEPLTAPSQFTWQASGDLHLNVPGQGHVPINTHKQEAEDVEVMSTDSSSSSSSDSQ